MAIPGSFQRTPRADPGAWGTDIMYRTSLPSANVMNPWAKPFGTHSARRLSAVSSTPSHRPRVREPARKSTITSNTAPAVQRTSFSSAWGSD